MNLDRIVIGVVLALAAIAFIGVIANDATCEVGHIVSERQAKGTFNHFVCDVRKR